MILFAVSSKRGLCRIRHLSVETDRGGRRLEEDMLALADSGLTNQQGRHFDLILDVRGALFRAHKVLKAD